MARRYLMLNFSGCEGGTAATVPAAAAIRNPPPKLLLRRLGRSLCFPRSHDLVYGDRQVADAPAGGVEDGVGDGGGRADDADLTQPLDPDRTGLVVLLIDEDHVDIVDIGVRRDVV